MVRYTGNLKLQKYNWFNTELFKEFYIKIPTYGSGSTLEITVPFKQIKNFKLILLLTLILEVMFNDVGWDGDKIDTFYGKWLESYDENNFFDFIVGK